MVKSGDQPADKQLLDTLNSNWVLKDKVLEYFDRVNWKQEKLEFMHEIYCKSFKTLKEQGLNTSLVDVLRAL
jgi:hypothetical protein